MLVPAESSSAVLVMIRSKSVSICNCSLARLDDSSRNPAFWRGYPSSMHSYRGLLEPRGSKLALLKSTFNAEIFTLEMCVAAWNREGRSKQCFLWYAASLWIDTGLWQTDGQTDWITIANTRLAPSAVACKKTRNVPLINHLFVIIHNYMWHCYAALHWQEQSR